MPKTIVQRYVGLNDRNSEIWLDTAWSSLPDALDHYPSETLREVQVTIPSKPVHTFWAQASDVNLRACCARHSH